MTWGTQKKHSSTASGNQGDLGHPEEAFLYSKWQSGWLGAPRSIPLQQVAVRVTWGTQKKQLDSKIFSPLNSVDSIFMVLVIGGHTQIGLYRRELVQKAYFFCDIAIYFTPSSLNKNASLPLWQKIVEWTREFHFYGAALEIPCQVSKV